MNTTLFVSLSWRPRWAPFVGGVFLFVLSVHSLFAAEPSTSTLELRYANGLIDAHLEQVPLGEVLQVLVRETGIEVNSLDPNIVSWRVSLARQSVPVDEAIKAILDGLSYALHAGPNKHEVIVASTPPRAAGTGIKKSGGERTLAALGHGGAKQGKDVPQTLDEFQPISEVALSYGDGGQEGDSFARSASGQEYNEALLERALTALGSQHRHLYEQAIDELAALQDPRAVEALAQAVLPATGSTPIPESGRQARVLNMR